MGFFEGDQVKSNAWLEVKNPLLGGLSPAEMIRLGRGFKLLKAVVGMLEENLAPEAE
ncbi:MAG: DUF2384 domain-containing protein [Rhodobacteraceae bacterium]|nr:DUF2384 domain-containing protein [Paracoccaceae bacterium]